MERLHTSDGVLLRNEDISALFVPATLQLFVLEAEPSIPLLQLSQSLRDSSPSPRVAPSESPDLDPFSLGRREALLPFLLERSALDQAKVRPTIDRLTLNISNACNLFCSYCYADQGLYHAPRTFMPADRAETIVSRILDHYASVSIVHFFGGEPLMNLAAIDSVGRAFAQAVSSGRLTKLPMFVATTNGTLSAKPVIEILRRWNVELTVSWDGPREVHDAGRPAQHGRSSYDSLVQSLQRFTAADIAFGIECTYNARHVAANISVRELMDFFHTRTPQRIHHISPASLPGPRQYRIDDQRIFRDEALTRAQSDYIDTDALIPTYREAARYTVRNIFAGTGPLLTFASSITEQILNRRRSAIYCPAFFNQLSIATDGTAYPCFMFIGDSSFSLGNVLSSDFPTQNGLAVFRRYFDQFGLSPVGTHEWYAPFFGGCVAGEFITGGTFRVRTAAALYEAMIEECLLEVAVQGQKATVNPTVPLARQC